MNYQDFINQMVINQNKESGVVIAFDIEHIIIQYENITKTYNGDIAFKTGFLKFINPKYQQIISEYLLNQESLNKKKEEIANNNQERCIKRHHKIDETYQMLKKKNKVLLYLFGSDFIYPPYQEFKKKYKQQISQKENQYFSELYLGLDHWYYYS